MKSVWKSLNAQGKCANLMNSDHCNLLTAVYNVIPHVKLVQILVQAIAPVVMKIIDL